MQNNIYMYLRIMEFEQDPEEIVNQLGVTPKTTWKIGDVISERTGKRYEYNGIEFASTLDKYASFDDHLSSLLSIVVSKQEQFIKVCSTCYTELACALYMYHDSEESTPAVHFDKQTLKVLAALGAEIDIDLYAL